MHVSVLAWVTECLNTLQHLKATWTVGAALAGSSWRHLMQACWRWSPTQEQVSTTALTPVFRRNAGLVEAAKPSPFEITEETQSPTDSVLGCMPPWAWRSVSFVLTVSKLAGIRDSGCLLAHRFPADSSIAWRWQCSQFPGPSPKSSVIRLCDHSHVTPKGGLCCLLWRLRQGWSGGSTSAQNRDLQVVSKREETHRSRCYHGQTWELGLAPGSPD